MPSYITGSPFLRDSFTQAGFTTHPEAHTPETGSTWIVYNGASVNTFIDDSVQDGVVYQNQSGPAYTFYYNAAAPTASGDFFVEAYYFQTANKESGSASYFGVVGRAGSGSANMSGYWGRWANSESQWQLCSIVSGTVSLLGFKSASLSANTVYRMRLEMTGSSLMFTVNGTQSVSASDSTHTAPGYAGFRFVPTALGQDGTNGMYLTAITGSNIMLSGSAGGGGGGIVFTTIPYYYLTNSLLM
jgi:hypothetical protein